MIPTPQEAFELLKQYNNGEFHLNHGKTVGGVMRWFSQELGYSDEADFWEASGILHDIDFEQYPDQHCIKAQEILREKGIDERMIHAIASHGYALTVDIKPEHEMEKVLFAVSLLFVGTGYFLMINFVPIQDINLLSDEELLELAKELAINYPVGEKLVLYGKIGIVITIILLACRFLTYIYFFKIRYK